MLFEGEGMLKALLRCLASEERAQASTEYVLVVSVMIVVLIGASGMVLSGLSNYYLRIISVVCLPIP